MSVPARLAAEWRARLAASGFEDLEGVDRDAVLSDRGNLHSAGEDAIPLQTRIEYGEAWTDWALDVLRHLPRGNDPASRLRYRVWERYASGQSIRTVSNTVPLAYHQTAKIIKSIEGRNEACPPPTKRPTWTRARTTGARRLARRAATETLQATAVALMLAALRVRAVQSRRG